MLKSSGGWGARLPSPGRMRKILVYNGSLERFDSKSAKKYYNTICPFCENSYKDGDYILRRSESAHAACAFKDFAKHLRENRSRDLYKEVTGFLTAPPMPPKREPVRAGVPE